MSETDRDVLALLDRAAAHTPPLHLDRREVVARGEQIVRRRRARGAGMGVGGLALAGAVWLGAGTGGGGPLGVQEISPAGVSWQVDEPVTVRPYPATGGDVAGLTITKTPGSSTATFTVDGLEETVVGRATVGGAELFDGEGAAVMVWRTPPGATGSTVVPVPVTPETGQITMSSGPFEVDAEPLAWWWRTPGGFEPEDIVFNDEDSVWTATGAVAETAEVTDGRVETTVFAIPGLELAGYLGDGAPTLTEPGGMHVWPEKEPWWRGGVAYTRYLVQLPDQAVFARTVWSDGSGEEVTGEQVRTTRVGEAAFASATVEGDEVSLVGPDTAFLFQWSHDGLTWHDQDEQGPTTGAQPPPVGPGGAVVLLDEVYEVATDAHGWPQLLEEDGSVFLTVSAADGPPTGDGGGVVLWREHWWPWSDRNEVHFAVEDQPVLAPEVEGQDAVTITGPAGEVGLIAVPAGS